LTIVPGRLGCILLQEKSEVFFHFLEFKALVEKQSGLKILTLLIDNGGEYRSNEFLNYCRKNGINLEFTNSYSPQQSGVAERKNRTIVEMAWSMLKTKSLGNEFWAEAVHTTFYTLNRCLTRAILNLTREKAWSGYKSSVTHIKVFGCTAYAHVPKEKRSKLDDKSVKCIFIGYSIETRSYMLFDP
jgi:transposase InsO family protein